MKVENVKPPKAPADAGSLHKKMMQLLSQPVGDTRHRTFARLGLADAMEAGADDAAAIAGRAASTSIASIVCCARSRPSASSPKAPADGSR